MSPGQYSPGVPASEYSEAAWQRQVIELLAIYGWDWWYHTHDSRMSPPGWPDIVAIRRRDRRILFAELKKQGGPATPEQLGVLELLLDVSMGGYAPTAWHSFTPPLGTARVDAYLWRPNDIDEVVEALR